MHTQYAEPLKTINIENTVAPISPIKVRENAMDASPIDRAKFTLRICIKTPQVTRALDVVDSIIKNQKTAYLQAVV